MGVGIVMFGTIAAAGIKTLSRVEINNRNLLIIATSIGLGLGVTFRPEFYCSIARSSKDDFFIRNINWYNCSAYFKQNIKGRKNK